MRIRLIAPSDPDDEGRSSGEMFKIRRLNLPLLAGLTPRGHEVEIIDESFAPSIHEAGPDLAGITVMTELARRAYQLGDHYRALGAKVVMGGVHATVLPAEALAHADAVVCGEAESLWAELVTDVAAGKLRRVYEDRRRLPLAGAPPPRWDIYPSPARRGYTPAATGIETSRGCPYGCEFCSVASVFGSRQRLRTTSEVMAEIEILATSHFFLVDDSLGLDRRASRELFTAMAPLGKSWVGQGTIALAEDPELLRLMRRSGCEGLLVGFETLHPGTRQEFRKLGKRIDPNEAIRRFHDAGLAILGAFVFGFDHEDPGVFDRTLEFIHRNRLDMAQLRLLVPFPGTELYARLFREGRLFAPRWWLDGHSTDTLLYRPIGMTPQQLVDGVERVIRETYAGASILKRYFGMPARRRGLLGSVIYAGLNLGNRSRYQECLRAPQPFLPLPGTVRGVGGTLLATVPAPQPSPVSSAPEIVAVTSRQRSPRSPDTRAEEELPRRAGKVPNTLSHQPPAGNLP